MASLYRRKISGLKTSAEISGEQNSAIQKPEGDSTDAASTVADTYASVDETSKPEESTTSIPDRKKAKVSVASLHFTVSALTRFKAKARTQHKVGDRANNAPRRLLSMK